MTQFPLALQYVGEIDVQHQGLISDVLQTNFDNLDGAQILLLPLEKILGVDQPSLQRIGVAEGRELINHISNDGNVLTALYGLPFSNLIDDGSSNWGSLASTSLLRNSPSSFMRLAARGIPKGVDPTLYSEMARAAYKTSQRYSNIRTAA